MLEGGASGRPPNVRLYVTSNRRHIVARDMAEQEFKHRSRCVVDDRLALADRFGLSLGFHVCDQETYLAMVSRYAEAFDLPFDAADALTWSTPAGCAIRPGSVALCSRACGTCRPDALRYPSALPIGNFAANLSHWNRTTLSHEHGVGGARPCENATLLMGEVQWPLLIMLISTRLSKV